MPADQRSQEDDLAAAELQQTIRRLIRTLPRKLRDALLLAGSGDYTYTQIGFILGVPVGHGEVARLGSAPGAEGQDDGPGACL